MITLQGFKALKHYEAEIDAIKRELRKLPSGILIRRRRFYYVKDGSLEKGITKDRKKVRQLARKAYLSQRLENLEWNYSLAYKQSRCLRAEDPKAIISQLSPACRSLPQDFFFHSSVQRFQERPIFGDMGRLDELIYLTDSGVRVRSKSERTIANMLDHFKIPFRYEATITLGGEIRYPDFSVFRPSDGKLVLWEHFGLMDHEGYRQKAIRKLSLYTQNGFLPFDNLICTYEKDLHDLSRIETLIEMFILR